MTTIHPYLNFNGTTEEAFNFYRSVFGGEIPMVMRYKDSPEGGQVSKEDENKVMHMALTLPNGTMLMGTDFLESRGDKLNQGNNFHLSVTAESEEEAKKVFDGLAPGGKIIMPIEKAFWGDYFGMLTDKFGIQWMVSASAKR